MKINFTKEHYGKLCSLALEMLMENAVVTTKMGSVLNIVDLLHTTTITSLNSIRLSLAKAIEALENQDEWVSSLSSQRKLQSLQKQKELVNLIIGWKRYSIELEETKKQKENLMEELARLKESQKTPEDKIKEIEEKIAGLGNIVEF